ncbi:MAG: aromatic ring-hydroxylating dioxygenase subunit alpha [Betaproteobacteria bacterium]|nr:aromatic ring-hydroxylating dioxygenase subunit alpha [Betaproteobacteria bacterium]
MSNNAAIDSSGLSQDWFPVARPLDLDPGTRVCTHLLETGIRISRDACGVLGAQAADGRELATCERHGLVWVCARATHREAPEFPESDDPTYRSVVCGPFGVSAAAPRIIENFLDMAHFPFVHANILGNEPHTEVRDYRIEEAPDEGGLIASDCVFWQPQSKVLTHGGSLVNYTYRVPRPLVAILAKLPQAAGSHGVAILLAVQPAYQERSIAWMVFCTTNLEPSDATVRANQDRVFLQDKPILENQTPARLPLGARSEMHLRCDRLSVTYRRYLDRNGVRFGVIPP